MCIQQKKDMHNETKDVVSDDLLYRMSSLQNIIKLLLIADNWHSPINMQLTLESLCPSSF